MQFKVPNHALEPGYQQRNPRQKERKHQKPQRKKMHDGKRLQIHSSRGPFEGRLSPKMPN
jgi:hypothetical protein